MWGRGEGGHFLARSFTVWASKTNGSCNIVCDTKEPVRLCPELNNSRQGSILLLSGLAQGCRTQTSRRTFSWIRTDAFFDSSISRIFALRTYNQTSLPIFHAKHAAVGSLLHFLCRPRRGSGSQSTRLLGRLWIRSGHICWFNTLQLNVIVAVHALDRSSCLCRCGCCISLLMSMIELQHNNTSLLIASETVWVFIINAEV